MSFSFTMVEKLSAITVVAVVAHGGSNRSPVELVVPFPQRGNGALIPLAFRTVVKAQGTHKHSPLLYRSTRTAVYRKRN